MNIRLLIRKGEYHVPVEGLVWHKNIDGMGERYGRAFLQIETENGWIDIPVVEGEPLDAPNEKR